MRNGLSAALVVAVLLLAAVAPVRAQTYEELPNHLEERAQSLYSGIMCPQCSGQTIGQSHAEIANIMRDVVRERLLAGETDQQIIDYLVESFGENVLASPPKSGVSLAVWIIPPIGLLLGGIGVLLAIRGLRRPAGPTAATSSPDPLDPALAPYLAMVDDELGDATKSDP